MPPIWSFDNDRTFGPPGSIQPNIRSTIVLPAAWGPVRFRADVAQNVKYIVTCMPQAAELFAIENAARSRSRSSLNTQSDSAFLSGTPPICFSRRATRAASSRFSRCSVARSAPVGVACVIVIRWILFA